jgi:hypothetical protein
MRKLHFIAVLLATQAFNILYAQQQGGVTWSRLYADSVLYPPAFNSGASGRGFGYIKGISNPSGGVFAIGESTLNYYNSQQIIRPALLSKISSTGVELTREVIPGDLNKSYFINSVNGMPQAEYYIITRCDTVIQDSRLPYPTYHLPYLTRFDSSGYVQDTMQISLDGIYTNDFNIGNAVQISSSSALVVGYRGWIDFGTNQQWREWRLAKVRLPSGLIEWSRSYRPHPDKCIDPEVVRTKANEFYITGQAGPYAASVIVDSNGIETPLRGRIWFQSPYNTDVTAKLLPLPRGRMALRITYREYPGGTGTQIDYGSRDLFFFDSLGRQEYRLRSWQRVSPTTGSVQAYKYYYPLLSSSADGSVVYTTRYYSGLPGATVVRTIERRSSIDTSIVYTWPLGLGLTQISTSYGTPNDGAITIIPGSQDDAYMLGDGKPSTNLRGPGYFFCARIADFGTQYIPTSLAKPYAIPQEQGQSGASTLPFTAYPNPTTAYITLEGLAPAKEVTVYNATGRAVQRFTPQSSTHGLNLSTLSSGLYVLRQGTRTIRIVRE